MCVLCRDTFSRSDILKRHFQKCSIRRGNPTNATHLSHPQAHVKKNAAAQKNALGAEGDVNHMNGMGNMPADGMVPFGLIPASDGMNNIANDQTQLSRSSSMNRLDDANRDRRNMNDSVMGASTRPNYEQPYNGDVSNNMSANINPQLANYSIPPPQNGLPMFGGTNSTQQSNLDWSQMFQPGAHNTYVNAFPPNVGQTQTAIKQEPSGAPARADGMLGRSNATTDATPFTDWGLPSSDPDPYQQLSNRILNFLLPPGTVMNQSTAGVDLFFQPDNIKDFLDKYPHFHVHFSMLHIPTFRIMDAYVGLVAGMCCVGACYSDRVAAANVREVSDLLKTALEGSSRMYASLSEDPHSVIKYESGSFGRRKQDIEELQAIILSHILFVWHGTPLQREKARRTFPFLVALARKAGLTRISSDSTLYSPLHQPELSAQNFTISNFDWRSWVEQEKRVRAMYAIFLFDAALGLYFNTGPAIDALELQLPLPADDAAWEARTSTECGEALGLYGPQAAKARNPDGTQRPKQPEVNLALKALLYNSYQIQPGTTNLYGKFILIHALLAMLRRVQLDGSAAVNRSNTPLSQHDWIVGAQAPSRGSTSGRATPVDGMGQLLDGTTMKTFATALDKFKSNWDLDMASQFPPAAVVHPRRYGFSKDAIHFYWLATYLLKNARATDLRMAPDQRFTHVIHLLKSVRDWVVTDGASRGEELGSVGDIDRDFGVRDLSLDMAQLFKPLPKVVESQGIASVRAEMGNGKGGMV